MNFEKFTRVITTKKNIFLLFILLIGNSSCIHNNGDIGDLFGMWQLCSIEENGETTSYKEGRHFISFQNKVVCLKYLVDTHVASNYYGMYQQKNDSIYFDFLEDNSSLIDIFQFSASKCQFSMELSPKKLILKSDDKRWNFKKYN